MYRIVSTESVNKIREALNYTDEQRVHLSKITDAVYPPLFNFKIGDLSQWITEEGISKQLDDFILRQGIVYYIMFSGKKANLLTICVEINLEDWIAMHPELMKCVED